MLSYRTQRTRFKRVKSIVDTYIPNFWVKFKATTLKRHIKPSHTHPHKRNSMFRKFHIQNNKNRLANSMAMLQKWSEHSVTTDKRFTAQSDLNAEVYTSDPVAVSASLCLSSLCIPFTTLRRRLQITLLQKKHQIFANHFIIACVCVCEAKTCSFDDEDKSHPREIMPPPPPHTHMPGIQCLDLCEFHGESVYIRIR